MESVSCASISRVIPSSSLINVKAGEIIDDEMCETNKKQDTINVAAHFLLML